MNVFQWIDGYKTYIAAFGAAILAAYYAYDGQMAKAGEFASLALGFAGVRHAISKATNGV